MRRTPRFRLATSARVRGFTILELVLVLVLITLTAAVSIWAFFARPEVTLDNAVHLLARDLRLAQNRATLLHRPVSLVFHDAGDGYRILDGLDEKPIEDLRLERIERTYSRDAIFEGVQLVPTGLASEGRVVFHGAGQPDPVGKITLSYRGETRTLEIEAGTGRILLTAQSRLQHGPSSE